MGLYGLERCKFTSSQLRDKIFCPSLRYHPQAFFPFGKRLRFVALSLRHFMKGLSYERSNDILGWFVFAVALFTYASTIEPTVSFWDCGEYIATASNLEVGHPPGAATFQMIGALFSALNFGDVQHTARAVNLMSALASAFAILFLFWSITAIAKKLVATDQSASSRAAQWAVLGSGLVGALTFSFSDTFWFSAVEAEVYAMNSFFNALVFWLILKWEARAHQPRNERWLVLIGFMLGLSFGVHLLVLLAIPAIVAIYYAKRFPLSKVKDFIILTGVAIGVLALVFKLIFPYTLRFFGTCELFFVNSVGLPFHTGTLIAALTYIAFFYVALRYTRKRYLPHWHTAVLFTLFLLIGTTSWIALAIRANTDTLINENNPDSAVGLLRYYNREQYGDWPVLYGPMYTAYKGGTKLNPEAPYRDGAAKYERDDETGRYEVIDDGKHDTPNYDPAYVGFFPRMYSQDPRIIQNYKALEGPAKGTRPSLWQNIHYFLDFQLGYMYLRYLMWNFAGRQNDTQGRGDLLSGNWKSGIHFIDAWRLGPQTDLPEDMARNKGANAYYFLPLLLGIMGIAYQASRDPKTCYALALLFLFTGLGVVVYTNVKPYEPRERDYAYVNSFYAFAIWVGLSVLSLYRFLRDRVRAKTAAILATALPLFASPVWMVGQNWDDHDRSNRYTARDMSANYLKSTDANAILLTHGDNDTFPLWYLQEIEHLRTDVKVINLSLLNTDWYIDQQKRKTWDAAAIPGRLKHRDYAGPKRDVIYHLPRPHIPDTLAIQDFIDWVKSPQTQVADPNKPGKMLATYPCRYIAMPVDKSEISKHQVVAAKDMDQVLDTLYIKLPPSAIYKSTLVVFDILADSHWKRPLYFTTGGGTDPQAYAFLQDYFQLEGLAYKVVPIRTEATRFGFGRVEADTMYEKAKRFAFGNMADPSIYHGEVNRNLAYTVRLHFTRLANALIAESQPDKAEAVLDLTMEKTPPTLFKNNSLLIPIIEDYYKLDKRQKAESIAIGYEKDLGSRLDYFSRFSERLQFAIAADISNTIAEYTMLGQAIEPYNSKLSQRLRRASNRFTRRFPWLFAERQMWDTIPSGGRIPSEEKADKDS